MATSSQIIKDTLRSNSPVGPCFEKVQFLVSSILIGILNLECAVRPPGNIDAAIPDVAVAMAINPLDRTLARSALYRNVLLVPPGPSTKKTWLLLEKTCSMISSNPSLYSLLRE
jgi:hypothetical protein